MPRSPRARPHDHVRSSCTRVVQELVALVARLAARDIVVSSLHCDWGSFGSWTLEAQKGPAADAYAAALRAKWETPGPDVLRVWWDGRECLMTIESAPTPALTSPGQWRRQHDDVFDSREAAIRFVEEYRDRWAHG